MAAVDPARPARSGSRPYGCCSCRECISSRTFRARREGCALPFSQRFTVAKVTPTAWAKSSWVIPSECRSCRIRSPVTDQPPIGVPLERPRPTLIALRISLVKGKNAIGGGNILPRYETLGFPLLVNKRPAGGVCDAIQRRFQIGTHDVAKKRRPNARVASKHQAMLFFVNACGMASWIADIAYPSTRQRVMLYDRKIASGIVESRFPPQSRRKL